MSDLIDEFNERRLDNLTSNKSVTVPELLRYALKKIESGELDPNSCVLVLVDDREGGYELTTFASNTTKVSEIAMLELAKSGLIQQML